MYKYLVMGSMRTFQVLWDFVPCRDVLGHIFWDQKKLIALLLLVLGTSQEASDTTIASGLSTTGKPNNNK